MSLQDKAMLVSFTLGGWSARKYDRKASEKVAQEYGTAIDVARVNKVLGDSHTRQAIEKNKNAWRSFHYRHTLPWGKDGSAILPSTLFDKYTAEWRAFVNRHQALVRKLESEWPEFVSNAQAMLKGMYNPDDYPTADQLVDKYHYGMDIDPIPSAGDFRLEMNDFEVARIRKSIEDRAQQAQDVAMREVWQRLFDAMERISETLSQEDRTDAKGRTKPPIFRDSLMSNLQELVNILPSLNLTGDQNLEDLRREVEKKFLHYKADDFRKMPQESRKDVAGDADAIMKQMAGYMGG